MKVLNGRGASDGIVMGRLKIIRHRVHDKAENVKSSDPEKEMNRLDCALIAMGEEFDKLLAELGYVREGEYYRVVKETYGTLYLLDLRYNKIKVIQKWN